MANRLLILPDLHQDLAWAERVLARELDAATRVLFLGDYFDTPPLDLRRLATARETAEWLLALHRRLGDRLTLLLGNHDCAYLAPILYPAGASRTPDPFACPGFSEETASVLHGLFSGERFGGLLEKFRFYHEEYGVLFSHAGLDYPLFGTTLSEVRTELRKLDDIIAVFRDAPPTVVSRCPPSGGRVDGSGLLWNRAVKHPERSHPGLPQVFGHTQFPRTVRTAASNLCLDGRQSIYGVLKSSASGRIVLTVRNDLADGREVAWAIPSTGFGDAVIGEEIRLTPDDSGVWVSHPAWQGRSDSQHSP